MKKATGGEDFQAGKERKRSTMKRLRKPEPPSDYNLVEGADVKRLLSEAEG